MENKSAIMAGVVQAIWDEYDLHKCEIQGDDSGWYVQLLGGALVSAEHVSCGDAVEEANAMGLTIINMDDVERWMQPPGDWGIQKEPTQ